MECLLPKGNNANITKKLINFAPLFLFRDEKEFIS